MKLHQLLVMFSMDCRAEAHFLNGHPKGWDAASPLMANVMESVRGFASCSLSRLERESLLTLPRGGTRLLVISLPSHSSGTEQVQCRVFS